MKQITLLPTLITGILVSSVSTIVASIIHNDLHKKSTAKNGMLQLSGDGVDNTCTDRIGGNECTATQTVLGTGQCGNGKPGNNGNGSRTTIGPFSSSLMTNTLGFCTNTNTTDAGVQNGTQSSLDAS